MSDFETNDVPNVDNDTNDALDREAEAILASFASRGAAQPASEAVEGVRSDAADDQSDVPEGTDVPEESPAEEERAASQGAAVAATTVDPAPLEALASADGAPVPDGVDAQPAAAGEAPHKRRKWPTVLLALLVLALGAYLAGAVAFMKVFLPNTTINGQDVSLAKGAGLTLVTVRKDGAILRWT